MGLFLSLAIFATVLGMFQFGWNTGVINAPQKEIEAFINETVSARNSGLDQSTVSLLFSVAVCAFVVGGMIGGLSAGWAAEKFGRKRGLLYTQIFVVLGAVFMGVCRSASSFELLILGRFSVGIACGLFTGLVPLYITEIAPVHLRGGLGTGNQLAVTLGLLLSQILGLEGVLGSKTNWPSLLALTIIPCLMQLCLLPLLPESPRFLVLTRNRVEVGRRALVRLRETDDVDDELEEIRQDESSGPSLTVWQVLKSSELRKPLSICVLMHLSQQITGIVGIFYYSTNIFIKAGINDTDAQYATLGVGGIMVIMTLITIPLMDRLGRRPLHLIGMGGMFFACVMITIAFQVTNVPFLVISTLSFVVFFALGPGSIPWLITGELFTQEPRPGASSIVTAVNWTASLVVTLGFPQLQQNLTLFTFIPFAVLLVILFVPLYFLLPETKNRSVQEIMTLMSPMRSVTVYSQDVTD